MTEVVFLSMHRTGSSVSAAVAQALGVHIGDNLLPAHYEDRAFLSLNVRILEDLGCSWRHPPSREKLLEARERWDGEIAELIGSRSQGHALWGWKDPRTCLTIPLYYPHLDNPVFVITARNHRDIVASLMRRNGGTPDEWGGLIRHYQESRREFLAGVDAPRYVIQYEELVSRESAKRVVTGLARALMPPVVDRALELINFQ